MPTVTAGSPVYGRDLTPSAYDQEWTTIANVTSTSYIAGSPEVGVAFTAPTSGKALVCIGAGIRNNAATSERLTVTVRVFEDSSSGVEFLAPTEENGIKSAGTPTSSDFRYVGNMSLITGMTPGRQYYFQVVHRALVGAGTADLSSRDILVVAQP